MRHTYFFPRYQTNAPGTKPPPYKLLVMLNAGLPATEHPTIFFKTKAQKQSRHNEAVEKPNSAKSRHFYSFLKSEGEFDFSTVV